MSPATTFRQFPSAVALPDGRQVDKALVLSAGGTVSIFAMRRDWPDGAETRTQQVTQVGEWEGAEVEPVEPGVHRIATPEGDVIVTTGSGCGGCGQLLPSWQP